MHNLPDSLIQFVESLDMSGLLPKATCSSVHPIVLDVLEREHHDTITDLQAQVAMCLSKELDYGFSQEDKTRSPLFVRSGAFTTMPNTMLTELLYKALLLGFLTLDAARHSIDEAVISPTAKSEESEGDFEFYDDEDDDEFGFWDEDDDEEDWWDEDDEDDDDGNVYAYDF